MNNEQDEQLKEMCITMINLLDKIRAENKISDKEYTKQTRIKKQFLDYLKTK